MSDTLANSLKTHEDALVAFLGDALPDWNIQGTLLSGSQATASGIRHLPEVRVVFVQATRQHVIQWLLELHQYGAAGEKSQRMDLYTAAQKIRRAVEQSADPGFLPQEIGRVTSPRAAPRLVMTLHQTWYPPDAGRQGIYSSVREVAVLDTTIPAEDSVITGQNPDPWDGTGPLVVVGDGRTRLVSFAHVDEQDNILLDTPLATPLVPGTKLYLLEGGMEFPGSPVEEHQHDTTRWKRHERTLAGARETTIHGSPFGELRLRFHGLSVITHHALTTLLADLYETPNLLLVSSSGDILSVSPLQWTESRGDGYLEVLLDTMSIPDISQLEAPA